MPVSVFCGRHLSPAARLLFVMILVISAALSRAASVHGIVTDASGARITGAKLSLLSQGALVAASVSRSDGSFQITTGSSGRFFLVVSAPNFRQLQTPDFYAGSFDAVEHNVVLEPAWVHESIVVAATGTPTPQPQTSSATTVLGPLDLAQRISFVDVLRLMPGAFVVATGQRGAQTSLFIRGGDSDASMVLIDGVEAGDLGGQVDFGPLSTTAVESAEVYRGPDSNIYGADAASGVVSLTTPHGTTSFPSVLFDGDAGSFTTSHEQLEIAGAHKKLDYLGAFSWLQTGNSLPRDAYHLATTAANLGWEPSARNQIRGTIHYGVSATGVPNAWDFYHVADNATQKDQNIYLSASINNQTTASFRNSVRYGLTRKREEYNQWSPEGTCLPAGTCGSPSQPPTNAGGNFYGQPVTIAGANGYSAAGQALLDYSWANGTSYPNGYDLASNRDQLVYQGDVQFTPHLAGLIGFRFEDERGLENLSSFPPAETAERTNYDYLAAVHGDFKQRFFYTLGGGLEHYSLFGTATTPRAGLSFYALRPRAGTFSGTRILFNFGEAVREPTLPQQFASLHALLVDNGYASTAAQLHIGPLAAPTTRTYEGGVEQAFLSQHILFRTTYFHNQFGQEIESVGGKILNVLIPGLTPAVLGYYYTDNYGLDVNTQDFRAQGVEANVEGGIGKSIFLRGGYTYLDAVVQHSFSSDNETLIGVQPVLYNGTIPVGAVTPLVGARPFRRPPHTGFFTATWAARRFTANFTSAFASRSDDSTYLEDMDANGGNSLLLPNRNLDFGYAQLDLGGSYQLLNWLSIYGQADNLLSNQHIAPIGYLSLPMNFRTGLRVDWGIRRR